MRRRLLAPCVLAALAASGGVAPAPAAAASSYCSPSGDQCYSAAKRRGVVRLVYATFSFTGKIRICVTPPRGTRTCRRFTLRERRGVHRVDVRWSAHFPNKGLGRYRVRYRSASGDPLGPAVAFRRG